LDTFAVVRNVHFSFDSINSILKPGIVAVAAGFLLKESYGYIKKMTPINEVVILLTCCFLLCVICMAILIIWNAVSKKDFK
jgi:predicted PurR-regulated permease PerM